MTKLAIATGLLTLSLTVAGCAKKHERSEGPMESAGEEVDQAASDVAEGTENAADETGDAVEEAGDKVEDRTD